MKSLRAELLQWVLLPLFCISLATTAIAYSLTFGLVRELYDDELLNSADSVITRATWHKGSVTVNIPPQVLAVMAHDSRDHFFYQLSRDGKVLGGATFLPVPEPVEGPKYGTAHIDGQELRTLAMKVPKEVEEPEGVMLLVAETRNARMDLVGQIFAVVMLPQVLLFFLGCSAAWLGVVRALKQLEVVRKAVSQRSPSDLNPVEVPVPSEIEPLVNALNRLFRGVDEDLERQRRFVANAAHQLRTPLAGLGTYCELAIRYSTEGKSKDVNTQMHSIIIRMTSLVNQLLTLARCESASSVGRVRKPVDLNSLASLVATELVPGSIEKGVDLELRTADAQSIILADGPSVQEMLKNLIDNAIKYTQTGGRVVVGIVEQAPHVVLYVDDNGMGIPESERPKVFERFYRIPNIDVPGTGLGLAIVNDVARAHHASIEITNGETGVGTRFNIYFDQPDSATRAAATSVSTRSSEFEQRVS